MIPGQTFHSPVHSGTDPAQAGKDTAHADVQATRAFETLFVSNMVDEMMKTVDMGSSMGEHPAAMWRSVLSEALAESLVANGGLGIAESIQHKISAYKNHIGEPDG